MESYKSKFTESLGDKEQLKSLIDELVFSVDEVLEGSKGASLYDIEDLAKENGISLDELKQMVKESNPKHTIPFAREAVIKAMEINNNIK